MIKKGLHILPILFVYSLLSAQEKTGPPNELDNMYTPSKNSIFNSENISSDDETRSGLTIKNTIKISPSLFARSIAAVFYERSITEGIGFQFGLGGSFNKDILFTAFSEVSGEFSFDDSKKSTLSLHNIMTNGSFTSGKNIFTSASVKFNFESYYSDWSRYFQMEIRYSSYSLDVTGDNPYNYPHIYGSSKNNIRTTYFNLVYGNYFVTNGKVKTVHECFVGTGFRSVSYNTYRLEPRLVRDYNGYLVEQDVNIMATTREKALSPVVFVGYIFGFGF